MVHRIRINLLCLLGVAIGLVAIFTPWSHYYSVWGDHLAQPSKIYSSQQAHDFWSLQWTALILFVAGLLTALVTALGGVLQITGILLFWYDSYQFIGTHMEGHLTIDWGSFIGFLSFAVVFASLLYPQGIGYRLVRLGSKERFLNFGFSEDSMRPRTLDEED